MAEFTIPIIGNLLESLSAEFRDKVKPVPGCVLRCDLAFGANFTGGRFCHTGIYLGNDEIAEITNIDGKAIPQIVDPHDFLNGQGTNFLRTGINIYVATDGCGNALGAPEISERARKLTSTSRNNREYDLIDNNCHKFTVRCITGKVPTEAKLSDRDVASSLKSKFGCQCVTWEPTGFGPGDFSFED